MNSVDGESPEKIHGPRLARGKGLAFLAFAMLHFACCGLPLLVLSGVSIGAPVASELRPYATNASPMKASNTISMIRKLAASGVPRHFTLANITASHSPAMTHPASSKPGVSG